MFKMIFGSVWLLFTSFIAYVAYGGNSSSISVNGQQVSQEQFNRMVGPKIFLGIFIAVGLWLFISGVITVFRNHQTNTKGRETYGVILAVMQTGCYVNNRAEYKAEVLTVLENNTVETFEEIIGFSFFKYKPGNYVLLKHYKTDINIVKVINPNEIPYSVLSLLESTQNILPVDDDTYNETENDTIVLNGVEYVRKR